ncbi:MAG: 30S ribosomal protein S3 [candidate division Zixibacteria bacterium]|nr:30S ribosomal protein S3 [candidate division Zixibacteria bacterium]
MGQKTHPVGIRLGIIRSWNSKWFAERNVGDLVAQDIKIRRYIDQRLENAGLANIEILRDPKKVTVDIHTSRPGIVIGRKGIEVDKLREELRLLANSDVTLNIIEVKRPELSARLVADSIARQLEGRISFRRAMKKSLSATMKMGAEGIKIMCGGRLGGAEIARSEKYMEGRVPLHTLRADIDYSTSTAHTAYGCIGVKVWICRGEILDRMGAATERKSDDQSQQQAPQRDDRRRFDRQDRGRGDRGDRGGRRGGPQQPQARGRIRKTRHQDDQSGDRGPAKQ